MAGEKQTIKIQPDTRELADLFRALSRMEKEAQTNLKDDVMSISRWVAEDLKMAASSAPFYPKQAELIKSTIKASRDRMPTITIGGTRRAPVKRQVTADNPAPTVGEILFGNEFGGERNAKGSASSFPNGGYKFPMRSAREGRGNAGYWIFPTVKELQPRITAQWFAAIEKINRIWGN